MPTVRPGIYTRSPAPADQAHRNVGNAERAASVLGGFGLVALAFRRPSLLTILGGVAGAELIRRGTTGYCPVYDALGVSTTDRHRRSPAARLAERGLHIVESVTVQRPRELVYAAWRDLSAQPCFMDHIERVDIIDNLHSHWLARGPGGIAVEWDAQIVADRPGQLLAWHSLPGSDIEHRGRVFFRDAAGGRGTEVFVTLDYRPPAGMVGKGIAKLFGKDPEKRIREGLRHFRQLLETGETPTTRGQPSGRPEERLSHLERRPGSPAETAGLAGSDRPHGFVAPSAP